VIVIIDCFMLFFAVNSLQFKLVKNHYIFTINFLERKNTETTNKWFQTWLVELYKNKKVRIEVLVAFIFLF